MKGKAITRRRTKVELLLEGTKKELELLITTSPMPADDTVLLIIEDISEFTQLKDIIPICVKCRRIRDDKDYWRSVESYFKDYVGVDFSHGICSECLHEFYPNFHIKSKERQSKRLKNQDVVC